MGGLDFEEIAFVDHLADDFVHIIRLIGIGRDQRVQAFLEPVPRIRGRPFGHFFPVRQRHEVDEVARRQQGLDVIFIGEVGDAGLGRVGDGTTQFLLGDDLVGHGLDHIGASDEHIAAVLHHEDEVGHRRRIDRTAGAGAHDQAELGDDTAGENIFLEHVGIAAERGDAFLDAGTAAVVDADDRRADLHRIVEHLADFLGMAFGQRAAEDGEILREDIDQAAVDRAGTGDDAVAGDMLFVHAEIDAIMFDIHVDFLERILVEQDIEPLTRGQLALGVLGVDPFLAAAEHGFGALGFQLCDNV